MSIDPLSPDIYFGTGSVLAAKERLSLLRTSQVKNFHRDYGVGKWEAHFARSLFSEDMMLNPLDAPDYIPTGCASRIDRGVFYRG
jgi:hypothetical protein